MSDPPYVPVEIHLGKLPVSCNEIEEYVIPEFPVKASEILVYSFVTIRGKLTHFQRGYYEISTTAGGNEYKQYMNAATGGWITVIDSANLWLPMGDDDKLRAKLICPEGEDSFPTRDQWSDVFILGYRS